MPNSGSLHINGIGLVYTWSRNRECVYKILYQSCSCWTKVMDQLTLPSRETCCYHGWISRTCTQFNSCTYISSRNCHIFDANLMTHWMRQIKKCSTECWLPNGRWILREMDAMNTYWFSLKKHTQGLWRWISTFWFHEDHFKDSEHRKITVPCSDWPRACLSSPPQRWSATTVPRRLDPHVTNPEERLSRCHLPGGTSCPSSLVSSGSTPQWRPGFQELFSGTHSQKYNVWVSVVDVPVVLWCVQRIAVVSSFALILMT